MNREPIKELYRITQDDGDVSAQTDAQVENHALRYADPAYAPIWKYTVPEGFELVFDPTHKFYVYIEDDELEPAEWGDRQKIQLQYWSADLKQMLDFYKDFYEQCKEPTDIDKAAHYERAIRAKAGDQIWICGKADVAIYTIDVSDSYFSLECDRFRMAF
jgi:hypothetical protein